ncbi:MAG: hypothetical protein WC499_02455 [Patescibacteria group bacterium]
MNIKLSKAEVEIADSLTWGQQELVKSVMLDGITLNGGQPSGIDASKLVDAKYKLLELSIKKITDDKGVVIPFSKDWVFNLSVEDGELLYNTVDGIGKKK